MDFTEDERAEFMLESGDILVCEGGDIGKAAIWNNEIPGCCYQKALRRIRCDRERALPRFMLHHLFWAANEEHWLELKTQTTIPHLTGVKLKAYTVFVPPLPEQRCIVAELDGLQTKVDSLKKLQAETTAELDALLPSILDKAFKGGAMKLPNAEQAVVDVRKLRNYCLNAEHPRGQHKPVSSRVLWGGQLTRPKMYGANSWRQYVEKMPIVSV